MGLLDRIFGRRAGGEPPEYRQLVEQSLGGLRALTTLHQSTFGIGEADWAVDQDAGTIVFTHPDGLTATCPVQIVGTYDTAGGTWLWGWDHPSVTPALQEHARRLREYGQEHGIARLTTRKLECGEDEAWEFAALACRLCGAQGAYRGPAGDTRVFMTFGEVTLAKDAPGASPAARPDANPEFQRMVGEALLAFAGDAGGKVLLYTEVEPGVISADVFIASPDGKTVRLRFADDALQDLIYDFWEAGDGVVAPRSWAAMQYVVEDGEFNASFDYPEDLGSGAARAERCSRAVEAHFPGAVVDHSDAWS